MTASDANRSDRPGRSKGLGDDIRRAREAAGLAKTDLVLKAHSAGWKTSDTQIARWESGQGIKAVDLFRLAALLPELRVNIAALLRAASKGDPGFADWHAFRATPEGLLLTDEEVELLVFFPWPADADPSVVDYGNALFVLRRARRKAK